MTWKERLIGLPLAALGAVLLLATAAGMALTRTDWGRERVRTLVLEKLNGAIQGRVEIDAVLRGDVLRMVRMAGVRVYEPDGREFAEIDTVEVHYRWSDFLLGSINIARVTLVGPVVTLRTDPEAGWNFERVFAGEGSSSPEDGKAESPGRRRRIVLRDVAIRSGDVTIRTPWEPGRGEGPESSRWFLEPVEGGGWERVFRFERLNTRLSNARVEAPADEGRLFQISQFSCGAAIVGHGVEIEQLRADIAIKSDTLSFRVWEGVLPDTRLSFGQGWVTLRSDPEYEFTLLADTVTTRDVAWLVPQLPPGVAQLDFSFSRRRSGIALEAQNARWESPQARLSGRFAMSLSDRAGGLRFDDVDLDIEQFSTTLIDSIAGWTSPLPAALSGHVALDGPLSELAVDADLRIGHDTLASSRVSAVGIVNAQRGDLGARDLTLRADTLQLDLVRAFVPGLALRGELAGEARLEGRLATGLAVSFDLVQRDRHLVPNHLIGEGAISVDSISPARFDVRMKLDSISLNSLAEYYPAIPFRGTFAGDVRVLGPIDGLGVEANLRGESDSLKLRGTVRLAGGTPRYEGQVRGWRVAIPEFRRNLPATDLDFAARFAVRGARLEELTGSGRLDVFASFVGGVGFDSASAALRIAGGRLWVDSSVVSGEFGALQASGALSLSPGVSDSMRFEIRADSLGALNPWFFPTLESMISPSLGSEDAVEPIQSRGGRVEGTAFVNGWMISETTGFSFKGSVVGERLSYGDVVADSFSINTFEVGESGGRLQAAGELLARGVGLAGLRFGELSVSGSHTDSLTAFDFAFDKEDAGAEGRVRIAHGGGARVIKLDDFNLRFGAKTWALAEPSEIHLGPSGSWAVDRLRAVSSEGELLVAGSVTAAGPVSLRIDLEGLELANLAKLWPDSSDLAGSVSAELQLSGAVEDPAGQGSIRITNGRWVGVDFSALSGDVQYQAGEAVLDLSMWDEETRMMRLHGKLPVDLWLLGLDVSLPARPMELTLEGDSIPLTLASLITDQVAEPGGRGQGTVHVGGTPRDLDLQGPVAVSGGRFRVIRTGIEYEQLQGQLRFHDNVLELTDVSFRGAKGGRGSATGDITFTTLSNPEFDLRIEARDLPAYDQLDAFAIVSGAVGLRGRYESPIVDGNLSVVSGVLFVEEVRRQKEIVNLFEEEFTLIDTGFGPEAPVGPGKSPFLENLTMELGLKVERDTWLRSAAMNVEIAGDLVVRMQPDWDEWRIEGTLQAVRGDYRLLSKRFQVEGGTIEFAGTPGVNPNLRIVALYTVQTQKQPIEIRLTISGTLEQMASGEASLVLDSDHQPPISQSDLFSYLLFGRPSYELTRTGEERNLIQDVTAGVPQAFLGYALSSLLVGEAGIAYVDVSRVTPSGTEGEYRSGVGPALTATQVEVGWYLAPTVFVSVAQHLVGAMRPTVRLDWRLDDNLTLRGITEPRFGREGVLFYGGPDPSLEQSIGVFLFYGWAY